MIKRFIPFITILMSISFIIFLVLQIYWVRQLFSALNQDFNNKIHNALSSSAKLVQEAEIAKYYKEFKNFDKDVLSQKDSSQQFNIQSVESKDGIREITFMKDIIQQKQIPILGGNDTLKLTRLYTGKAKESIEMPTGSTELLTPSLEKSLNSGEFSLRQFATVQAENMPIAKRIDKNLLEKVIKQELELQGIKTNVGYAILTANDEPTDVTNDLYFLYKNQTESYKYPLFADKNSETKYILALIFPNKNSLIAGSNIFMIISTIISLGIIVTIYILSLRFMARQKKIAEIKTDFINNMSHEFKTPIATISIAADSLANDAIATQPEKVKYYSRLIKSENIRMKNQVENILNMTKLERNEMQLNLAEENMRNIITELTRSFRLIVEERGGKLTENFTAQRYLVQVDRFHISNAIMNLLDNANKYSPDAPIISITTRNENQYYILEIKDEGIGLEGDNHERIFEKFYREETGNIHSVKGQGLGLSYVKQIIDLHGGQIMVRSKKGLGSTFIIKLPLNNA